MNLKELYFERCAIREFDGGLSKQDAEQGARRDLANLIQWQKNKERAKARRSKQ